MAVDLIAYRRSIIDLPPEQTPLTRIVRQVDAFERGRHGGRHDDIDAMAKQAARQAVFAYELVLALEAEAASFARRYEAVMLLTLHRLIDEIRECCRTDEEGLSCISHHRAPGAAARAAELYEQEREARLRLEEQYLGGRSTLFPATVAAWDRLEGHADMLSIVLTHRFARAGHTGLTPGLEDDDPVGRRADDLRDDALMPTHDFFGESDEAHEIARRRIIGMR